MLLGADASRIGAMPPLLTICLEEVFSETGLPVYSILGNSIALVL
jgi:hypothetical protein